MGAPEPSDTSTMMSIKFSLNQTRNLHILAQIIIFRQLTAKLYENSCNDSAVFFLSCKIWNKAREGQKIGQLASCLSEIKFDQMPSMNPFEVLRDFSTVIYGVWITFKLILCCTTMTCPTEGLPTELRARVRTNKMIYTDQKSIYVHSSAAYRKNWIRKKKGVNHPRQSYTFSN